MISSTFDPLIFCIYLLALLPSVIGADPAKLDTLFDDEFEERVGRFVTRSGGVIYAVKSRMMSCVLLILELLFDVGLHR
ncbi:hypothetical protein AN958_00032 [Leucoagaricus sp. SymC.cos]|nr:hypothetical protein AN958_00032 [Leucoagaricus sp. SymC.cos]